MKNPLKNYVKDCFRLNRTVLIDRFGKCLSAKSLLCEGCSSYNLLKKGEGESKR